MRRCCINASEQDRSLGSAAARGVRVWLLVGALLAISASARAQGAPSDDKPSAEVYGFAMLDMGHNFTSIDPAWFDTLRLTKLPSTKGEFGHDNSTFSGVRQSRLGVKS